MSPDMNEETVVREAITLSRRLMTLLSDNFESPMDAYIAVIFAAAMLTHGMDIEIDHTLDGIRAAFGDISAAPETKQ